MNYTFIKKDRFYDYFPSLPMMRLRMDFGMEYYEQTVFKQHLQRLIEHNYKRLVDQHDLKHVEVYPKIGDEFDRHFYDELKQNVLLQMRNSAFWDVLDNLIMNQDFASESEFDRFRTQVLAITGEGIPRFTDGSIRKKAFITLFQHDFDKLSGQEILYLSEIN